MIVPPKGMFDTVPDETLADMSSARQFRTFIQVAADSCGVPQPLSEVVMVLTHKVLFIFEPEELAFHKFGLLVTHGFHAPEGDTPELSVHS